jgi:hypothetical protein
MIEDARGCADTGAESRSRWPQPGELWNLWDMYNFVLVEFHHAFLIVAKAHDLTRHLVDSGQPFVPPLQQKELAVQFESVAAFCAKHDFPLSQHVCAWLLRRLKEGPIHTAMLRDNTRSLSEALTDDASKIRAYIYRNERADFLSNLDNEWASVFLAFPETEIEIKAAVDLWALGHSTASVFHTMRACELGLRFLAKKVGVKNEDKPLEWMQWGALIKEMDKRLLALTSQTNGPKKDAEKVFLGGALSHMRSLQEKRDAVMHVRRQFDEHEARSVFLHVHGLFISIQSKYPKGVRKA